MGSGGIAPTFVTSALYGGEWSASLTVRFTRGERAPGTHWIWKLMGSRTGLDAVENWKISCFCRESNPGHPTRSPFLYRLSYPGSYLHVNFTFYFSTLIFFFKFACGGGGVQAGSTRHVGHWMAYCTCPGWLWWWRNWWNEDWQGKPKYSEKTFPSATLSTTNPTWPDPGAHPGRRGRKPATNRLSYGAAF
jgi:hypothetical protein